MTEADRKSSRPARRREPRRGAPRSRPAELHFPAVAPPDAESKDARMQRAMYEANVVTLAQAGMSFDDKALFERVCGMAGDPEACRAHGAFLDRLTKLADLLTARAEMLRSFHARSIVVLDRVDRDRPDLANALADGLAAARMPNEGMQE